MTGCVSVEFLKSVVKTFTARLRLREHSSVPDKRWAGTAMSERGQKQIKTSALLAGKQKALQRNPSKKSAYSAPNTVSTCVCVCMYVHLTQGWDPKPTGKGKSLYFHLASLITDLVMSSWTSATLTIIPRTWLHLKIQEHRLIHF